jgi:hypothetical protein
VGTDLDVSPRPMEVAACWLPAGTRVALDGRSRTPDRDHACYAVIGWDKLADGAALMVTYSWQGIRNGQDKFSRPVWDQAAKVLRQAERANAGPAVVYVAIEEQVRHGRKYLTAVRVRAAGE